MSHFCFKILRADGTEKVGMTTAKTEDVARSNVLKLYPDLKELRSIGVVAPQKGMPHFPKPLGTEKKSASPTKLDRLLFLQSGKCFFCGKGLERSEASIEHIQAKARGGSDSHENTVACCIRLNQVFGDLGLKEKLRLILESAGAFRCPEGP